MRVGDPHKLARLEARISLAQKELFQRAAALEGTTVTEFVVRSAQRAAEESVQAHTALQMTAHESEAFVQALLNPPGPNAALRTAATRYQQIRGNT